MKIYNVWFQEDERGVEFYTLYGTYKRKVEADLCAASIKDLTSKDVRVEEAYSVAKDDQVNFTELFKEFFEAHSRIKGP